VLLVWNDQPAPADPKTKPKPKLKPARGAAPPPGAKVADAH
jgi:hypothetical protein